MKKGEKRCRDSILPVWLMYLSRFVSFCRSDPHCFLSFRLGLRVRGVGLTESLAWPSKVMDWRLTLISASRQTLGTAHWAESKGSRRSIRQRLHWQCFRDTENNRSEFGYLVMQARGCSRWSKRDGTLTWACRTSHCSHVGSDCRLVLIQRRARCLYSAWEIGSPPVRVHIVEYCQKANEIAEYSYPNAGYQVRGGES